MPMRLPDPNISIICRPEPFCCYTAMYPAFYRNLYSKAISDGAMEHSGGLVIGASTSFGTLVRNPAVREYAALHMALRTMANTTNRREKTLLRALLPDKEVQGTAAALTALDARLSVVRPHGERIISLIDYFGQEKRGIQPGETVRSFVVPQAVRASSVYQSVDYLRSGVAICGVAIWARRSQDTFGEVRVVLSGCTPHPVLLPRIGAALHGQECVAEGIEKAIRKLEEEPLTIHNPLLTQGSHLFNLSKTLIKRALLTL
jgi:CO/xanthine dehydrogenase FAD-binding subunit